MRPFFARDCRGGRRFRPCWGLCHRHGALERSFQQADDVDLMGHRLLYEPRGPMALYPHGPIGFRGPWWISWSQDPDDENQPAAILNLLESSALGYAWLLDR